MRYNVITGTFSIEVARWDSRANQYVDRKTTTRQKDLTMEIIRRTDGKDVIRFVGGPTGHESYYVADLLASLLDDSRPHHPSLCICGGTVNSWPRCEVPVAGVLRFLEAAGFTEVTK